MARAIAFCATGKTGLGHLRRIANIARAVRERDPARSMALLTNAPVEALPPEDGALFRRIEVTPRQAMARRLSTRDSGPVVVDTAVLPRLHAVERPLCLVLRETIPERLPGFRLENGRPWDLIVLPQPAGEWRPDPDLVPARRVAAVGYIYRRPHVRYQRGGSDAPSGSDRVRRRRQRSHRARLSRPGGQAPRRPARRARGAVGGGPGARAAGAG